MHATALLMLIYLLPPSSDDGTRYNISSTGECTARDANSCTHGYFLLSNDQFNTVIAVVNDPPGKELCVTLILMCVQVHCL